MSAPLSWAPSLRAYARQAILLAIATFAVCLALTALSQDAFAASSVAVLLVPIAVTAIFVLEDYSRWRRVRSEHWAVEDGFLIHESIDGRAMLRLEEIVEVRKRFTGAVVLQLENGQSVPMRYVQDPDAVLTRITALLENPLVQPSN